MLVLLRHRNFEVYNRLGQKFANKSICPSHCQPNNHNITYMYISFPAVLSRTTGIHNDHKKWGMCTRQLWIYAVDVCSPKTKYIRKELLWKIIKSIVTTLKNRWPIASPKRLAGPLKQIPGTETDLNWLGVFPTEQLIYHMNLKYRLKKGLHSKWACFFPELRERRFPQNFTIVVSDQASTNQPGTPKNPGLDTPFSLTPVLPLNSSDNGGSTKPRFSFVDRKW